MSRVVWAVFAALLALPLVYCVPATAQTGKPRVVTSITPLADLIRNVGGDRIELTALVPFGGEPEDYDPTPADARAVGRASIFFANGLGFEAYLDNLIEAAGASRPEVVTLSDGLPTLGSFGQGAAQGGNPHLWLDPALAIAYVDVIQETLGRLDAANAAFYRANAQRYTAELSQLDAEIRAQVESLPASQRVLVGTHDAYPYFCERYNLVCLAVISANPGSDPSAQEYAQLVKTVRDYQVKAVFGEAGFSERFVSQLAADTGARYVASLYTDTLTQGPPAESYIAMMRHNTEQIVTALR